MISREPLTELMPLQRATNSDALMTQYEMHGIEALGLLKFDFLGLSNLTILRKAVDLIRDNRNVAVDLDAIPLDDPLTFELLASGETTGVFQLESPGMRRYVRELRPTSVFDLAAMVALYRPGPMDNIPAYIRRKHGEEAVTYLHPLLEPYLEKTYGIFVYQEDIMSAAVALGGFTGPEADTLGYAIRKKKSSVLRAQKERFVTQAAERGVEPKVIDAVFKAFEPFERYGFNKAHATCYGLIAYQTAYLKANYTVEYMTSVLTAFRDNAEKVAAAVVECRRLGIEVRPPDVHRSGLGFTVEGDSIRFGLLAVKNVGEGAIESIIAARESGGEFRSLTDFCSRVDVRLANRKVLESLAKVGALNMVGHPAQVLLGLDDALATGQATQRDRITGQTSLFDVGGDDALVLERPLPETPETPVRERLRWEKELLGLYLSDHPMGEVAERVGQFVTAYSGDLKDESLDGQRVVLGGIVTGIRSVITKSKSTMAVVTLEDLQGTLEVVVFPRTYEQTIGTWRDGAILLVAGRVDHRGEEASLLADAVWDWDTVADRGPEAFAREVGALDRRGGGRRGGPGGQPPNGNGYRDGGARPEPVAVGPGRGAAGPVGRGSSLAMRPCACRRPARPRSRRRTCRASPRGSPSPPTPSRRTSPRPRWPRASRSPTNRRSPTSSATSRRRPRRRRASRWSRRPARCSTCGSRATPAPIVSCPRCRPSRTSCAAGRAGRGSSSTCRPPAARRCRWSCGAWPTTPSCWARSGAGSAKGSSTSAWAELRNRTTATGRAGGRRVAWWARGASPTWVSRRRRRGAATPARTGGTAPPSGGARCRRWHSPRTPAGRRCRSS